MDNGSLNGPMGMAEGFNGVTQGNVGAVKGGDVNPTSSLTSAGGTDSVLNAGTLMAIKAMLPAMKLGQQGQQTTASQGGSNKQLGQQQGSSQPVSPGGPGVSAVGNNQNLSILLKSILGL